MFWHVAAPQPRPQLDANQHRDPDANDSDANIPSDDSDFPSDDEHDTDGNITTGASRVVVLADSSPDGYAGDIVTTSTDRSTVTTIPATPSIVVVDAPQVDEREEILARHGAAPGLGGNQHSGRQALLGSGGLRRNTEALFKSVEVDTSRLRAYYAYRSSGYSSGKARRQLRMDIGGDSDPYNEERDVPGRRDPSPQTAVQLQAALSEMDPHDLVQLLLDYQSGA
jgi:hypothetical protein